MALDPEFLQFVDDLITTPTNDWRELCKLDPQLTAADLEAGAELSSDPKERLMLRRLLGKYRQEIVTFVVAAIADGRPELDKENCVQFLWHCPVQPRGGLEYPKVSRN